MKKTLLLGLLAAAIMTLSFTGCKNNPDLGTAPKIKGVIILTPSNYTNTFYWDDAVPLAETNLSLSSDYRLAILMEDPDIDIVEVVISKEITFNNWWHWTNLEYTKEAFWSGLSINFSEMNSENKEAFKMENGTFYVKLIDSKGNESNIGSVSGITIQ